MFFVLYYFVELLLCRDEHRDVSQIWFVVKKKFAKERYFSDNLIYRVKTDNFLFIERMIFRNFCSRFSVS